MFAKICLQISFSKEELLNGVTNYKIPLLSVLWWWTWRSQCPYGLGKIVKYNLLNYIHDTRLNWKEVALLLQSGFASIQQIHNPPLGICGSNGHFGKRQSYKNHKNSVFSCRLQVWLQLHHEKANLSCIGSSFIYRPHETKLSCYQLRS